MAACKTRRVSLELLRPGPAHNFLLSPLTDYLGIAAQGTAEVINMPYEHGEVLRRLKALRYPFAGWSETDNQSQRRAVQQRKREAEKERQATLLELSTKLTAALCSVPGLGSQLSRRGCNGSDLVHLEVVVSAAELAMLPFELLGILEHGPPDPGRFLLLAGNPPVCLTRRVRSVTADCVDWTRPPRILFVSAAPGNRTVPLDEHQMALQKALTPWIPFDAKAPKRFFEHLKSYLTVVENATIAKVADACAKDQYTYVHILAHGESLSDAPGQTFGVALQSDKDPNQAHVVTGAQLASAIQRDGGRSAPTVVSLAMCDSGNVSDVIFTGASFAHELHRTGVPFVVASQFPLAFNGSTVMTEMLYGALLRGDDPREMMVELRTRLHALYAGESHDWASLVVYAALPDNLDVQLERFRYLRARAQLEAALKVADDNLKDPTPSLAGVDRLIAEAEKRLPTEGQYRTESLGLRGAGQKRLAKGLFLGAPASAQAADQYKKSLDCLRAAWRHYDEAAREILVHEKDATTQYAALHWILTQAVGLDLLLNGEFDQGRWAAAELTARADTRYGRTRDDVAWGHSSLLELHLLKAWHEKSTGPFAEFEDAAKQFIAHTEYDDFPVRSTVRQLQRYLTWWWTEVFRNNGRGENERIGPSPSQELRDAVADVAKRLADRARTDS